MNVPTCNPDLILTTGIASHGYSIQYVEAEDPAHAVDYVGYGIEPYLEWAGSLEEASKDR